MAKKALIVQGGWLGHYPVEVAVVLRNILEEVNFEVEVSETLDAFSDCEKLKELDLIVPNWTLANGVTETDDGMVHNLPYVGNIAEAVESGVGLAGCHGGMCATFVRARKWHFLTGGLWVAHPGKENGVWAARPGESNPGREGTHYTVNIKKRASPIVEGIDDFSVISEQSYMLVDPVIDVLATSRFPGDAGPYEANGVVDMPVVWTKRWGKGRVFYCSLGHEPETIRDTPEVVEIFRRGFRWATGYYDNTKGKLR